MKSVSVVFLCVFLISCQSGSENGTSEVSFAQSKCEKSKAAGNYNTVEGRAVSNLICSGRTFPDYKTYSTAAWREMTRQDGCKQATGKLCED